jgi:uncharacterized membrane protein (UPF0182 family)
LPQVVVVVAYNGTVEFYLKDSLDPIAATYQRIFPDLFKPFAAMPADLQNHIRYPEDLFLIQVQLYQAYHMEAADVFYNREDLWQFPRQPGGNGTARMVPYYIIMRLLADAMAISAAMKARAKLAAYSVLVMGLSPTAFRFGHSLADSSIVQR